MHVADPPAVALSRAGRQAPAGRGRGPPATTMSPSLLAFDSSTETLAVAAQSGSRLCCCDSEGGALASSQLLPQVRRLLQQAGIRLEQLQAIAFGAGPGAFTGLRTACAVAQGLALGAGLPLRPLDSLMIVAEGVRREHAQAPADIDVVMDARMGEAYTGRYRWDGRGWRTVAPPALHSLDSLHAAWELRPPRCVAGSALPAFAERLHSGAALRLAADIDRAAALMRLAQQRWRDEGGIDAAAALPLYLRDKVALTVAERAALRHAEAAR